MAVPPQYPKIYKTKPKPKRNPLYTRSLWLVGRRATVTETAGGYWGTRLLTCLLLRYLLFTEAQPSLALDSKVAGDLLPRESSTVLENHMFLN